MGEPPQKLGAVETIKINLRSELMVRRNSHDRRLPRYRQPRISKIQLAEVPKVDLDVVQDHPPGPQAEFEDWCEMQDAQFDRAVEDWR